MEGSQSMHVFYYMGRTIEFNVVYIQYNLQHISYLPKQYTNTIVYIRTSVANNDDDFRELIDSDFHSAIPRTLWSREEPEHSAS